MELPVLRQDLRLLPGSKDEAGEKSWLLYDPLRHQYFALTQTALILLRHLPKISSLGELKDRLRQDKAQIDDFEIEQFINFLQDNFLSVGKDKAHSGRIAEAQKRRQHHWLMWLIHNYLFIKIPLMRPDNMLARLLPVFRLLASRPARLAVYACGLYGLGALVWQWDSFLTTFNHFFNWQGFSYYVLALICVKLAHELGHAFVAKHFGLRVSSMGVALLVLFPVLYTDNTDAWRLTDQRKKLRIVLAGLWVELHIAMLALFAWSALGEGPAKSAAFFLATTSIVGSLLVNLSPFMRFDGYYAMADFLGMQNLQPRAFELARWQLRQWLFGLPENAPEPFAPGKHMFLVIYSFATWIYRLFLFIGIALLVYFMAFKILGILLFIIEIVYFIARPIIAEMRRWWAKRALFSVNRQTRRTLLVGAGLMLLAFAPWRTTVSAPAVIESVRQVAVHLPEAARIQAVYVSPEQYVEKDQLLLSAVSPELEHRIDMQARKLRLLQLEVRRYATSDKDLKNKLVGEQKLAEAQSRLLGYQKRRQELEVRAPQAGRLQFSQNINPGHWVLPQDQLFFLFQPTQPEIIGFINENDMRLVEPEKPATFIANDGLHGAHAAKLLTIESVAIEALSYPELSSLHGGPIAVEGAADTVQKPRNAYYKARAHMLADGPVLSRNIAGKLYLPTKAYAPAGRLWDSVAALFVRESGF